MSELQRQETDDYKTHVMALINCLILASDDITQRSCIRNEFIGMASRSRVFTCVHGLYDVIVLIQD